MNCQHKYYIRKEGKLVCSQCGEPSPKRDAMMGKAAVKPEDKAMDKPEDKAMSWPPESKRQTRVIKGNGRNKRKRR